MDGAKWSAWLTTFASGSVEETVAAALAVNKRVRALVATRAATSEAAGPSSAWQVWTLEAVVGGVERLAGRRFPALSGGPRSGRARALPTR